MAESNKIYKIRKVLKIYSSLCTINNGCDNSYLLFIVFFTNHIILYNFLLTIMKYDVRLYIKKIMGNIDG